MGSYIHWIKKKKTIPSSYISPQLLFKEEELLQPDMSKRLP